MCGSPLYMAPELLTLKTSAHSYNAMASDCWSCGACLYSMVLDDPPFPAESYMELVQMATDKSGPVLPGEVSKELRSLIHGLMNIDVHRRLTIAQARQHAWLRPGLAAALVRAGSHG